MLISNELAGICKLFEKTCYKSLDFPFPCCIFVHVQTTTLTEMTTTTNNTIATGTRVRTNGNIANLPAFGIVTSVYANKFGTFVAVLFDSPRFEGDDQTESYPVRSFSNGNISVIN